jgi:hypothetical protein
MAKKASGKGKEKEKEKEKVVDKPPEAKKKDPASAPPAPIPPVALSGATVATMAPDQFHTVRELVTVQEEQEDDFEKMGQLFAFDDCYSNQDHR